VKDPKAEDRAKREALACRIAPIDPKHFNPRAKIPYGLEVKHIAAAMAQFTDFLGFMNQQLATKKIERLETMLMPANFSSIVGEFMTSAIPKHCKTLVKNAYHNGHPDMLPAGKYPDNKQQHGTEGIEVKGSRYFKSWQGHNAEDAWLMVFCFSSSRPTDVAKGILPAPFKFVLVVGAQGATTECRPAFGGGHSVVATAEGPARPEELCGRAAIRSERRFPPFASVAPCHYPGPVRLRGGPFPVLNLGLPAAESSQRQAAPTSRPPWLC
jgi:hypothetical protein